MSTSHSKTYDFIVIGAGIVGLTIARELALKKSGRVLVLEKEPELGRHASGRNSGVIHAGIYYAQDSLKARYSVEGHRKLLAYAAQKKIPFNQTGKVIVAQSQKQTETLETLVERACINGVKAERVNLRRLGELEPLAKTQDWAIWSPDTAIIDSKLVLESLRQELVSLGVDLQFGAKALEFDLAARSIKAAGQIFSYQHLFNAGGCFADKIAHQFGIGLNYRILPFKGLYWQAGPSIAGRLKRLIYPAPDINMPFLGIHLTLTTDGKVLFGPTAIPAFGRENYGLVQGVSPTDLFPIIYHLSHMMLLNRDNLRRYVWEEFQRYFKSRFFAEAKTLVHDLKPSDIGAFYKVGIRAQLINRQTEKLITDFLIEKGPHSTHVLNAVSPAFTSALAMAPDIIASI